MAAYSASKAAVIGLAKATAKEYAETGITVNSLAPAVVKTAMVAAIDPCPGQVHDRQNPHEKVCMACSSHVGGGDS